MNGPTGAEVIGMEAHEAASAANHAARRRYEAAEIMQEWLVDPEDVSTMTREELSTIVTDLVAAVRVLSGLPAYMTPAEKWRREN